MFFSILFNNRNEQVTSFYLWQFAAILCGMAVAGTIWATTPEKLESVSAKPSLAEMRASLLPLSPYTINRQNGQVLTIIRLCDDKSPFQVTENNSRANQLLCGEFKKKAAASLLQWTPNLPAKIGKVLATSPSHMYGQKTSLPALLCSIPRKEERRYSSTNTAITDCRQLQAPKLLFRVLHP